MEGIKSGRFPGLSRWVGDFVPYAGKHDIGAVVADIGFDWEAITGMSRAGVNLA